MPSLQNQRYARFTRTSRQISRSERLAKTYPTTSIRIINPDRSRADPWTNNELQVRWGARKDREQYRSSAPDDLRHCVIELKLVEKLRLFALQPSHHGLPPPSS